MQFQTIDLKNSLVQENSKVLAGGSASFKMLNGG